MTPHAGRSRIQAGDHIFLRLPSGALKPVDLQPKTALNIGKFGSFQTKSLIGRPYYLTYDILDKLPDEKHPRLRVVPAAELNSETLAVDNGANGEYGTTDAPVDNRGPSERVVTDAFEIIGEDGEVLMRNNRLTIDDPSRQALTLEEIEELKRAGTGSGKEVIAKIMAAHSALGEKTSFSLAKYMLRKTRKYLKRFQVLPMTVGLLTEFMLERDGSKILDLRDDLLSLICSWSNVHHAGNVDSLDDQDQRTAGRTLVVDDTGGLVVAALAERKGILYPPPLKPRFIVNGDRKVPTQNAIQAGSIPDDIPEQIDSIADIDMKDATNGYSVSHDATAPAKEHTHYQSTRVRRPNPREFYQSASSNTITIVHAATQPNLSILKYFNYNLEDTSPDHPLFTNLKSLTWLQLLDPEADAVYAEKPEELPTEVIDSLKSGKRSTYYRKLRRWHRTNKIVDETRLGGFDNLVVASHMDNVGVLKELIPLVKGGGQIVVYSPNVEPLTLLMDYYSRDRRTAYQKYQPQAAEEDEAVQLDDDEEDDFPLNPTLLLNPMLQTARAIQWQVLPGRTHPMMTSKGGPEGYIFSATRVIPIDGNVAARGKFNKKRKTETEAHASNKRHKGRP